MTADTSDSVVLTAAQRDAAADATRRALANEPRLLPGHVWLVGAGPGDPSQLTLQALAALTQADIIVHDALVDARVLALAASGAELVFAGKRGGRPSIQQDEICERLIGFARAGHKVIRLKGGDPYIFARGGEEVVALARAGIPFRVIAGLTSGLAALTAASIPATLRGINQSLVLVTGHEGSINSPGAPDWSLLAKLAQPLVIYMALRNLAQICDALAGGGLGPDVPVAVIAAVGSAQERVIVSTLAQARGLDHTSINGPAIIVVGQIVAHRARLQEILAKVSPDGSCSAGTYP